MSAVTRLIHKVAGKRDGIREHNVLRLVYSFLLSHFFYVAPILPWHNDENQKLNTMLRQAIKRKLGLPGNTKTERLTKLGLGNTIEEIIGAQTAAQRL